MSPRIFILAWWTLSLRGFVSAAAIVDAKNVLLFGVKVVLSTAVDFRRLLPGLLQDKVYHLLDLLLGVHLYKAAIGCLFLREGK